jgi:multiple sugar transport system ATP-binding protein
VAAIAFEHVEKVYPGGTRAIVDLNLEVADGELLVLVGPSGCGKSTLLRLVAGLEGVSGGTLRIGAQVANDLGPRERNVAMVFQDYALYPHKTVRGNLEFPLRMRGLARDAIAQRVAWAAEILDIAGVLDRLPRQLSGGQQQRVAMGRALVREPAVFLLDEPLSNLDAKLRVEVRAEIADLQRRMKTTMLYVTHDQTEAMTLGHRVAVMKAGRVLQIAPPRELYEQPADAFVASFIGNPPMNLLPATPATSATGDGGERLVLRVAGGTLEVPSSAPIAARLRDAGDELTIGIRPEALGAAADREDASGAVVLRARVEHVEWLGHETLVHVRLGAAGAAEDDRAPRLVARLQGLRELERGEPITLRADPAALHLFGRDGRALAAAA